MPLSDALAHARMRTPDTPAPALVHGLAARRKLRARCKTGALPRAYAGPE